MSAPQPPASNPLSEASDEFSRIFGNALMLWAYIEQQFFAWFLYITELDPALGRAIYYSFNGFDGRANMLGSVISVTSATEAEKAFLTAAVKKAKKFAQFRNGLAHGQPALDVRSAPKFQFQFANNRHEYPRSVDEGTTIEKLVFASDRFNELLTILAHSRAATSGIDEAGPLEELQRRVSGLPNPDSWDQAILNEKAQRQPPESSPE